MAKNSVCTTVTVALLLCLTGCGSSGNDQDSKEVSYNSGGMTHTMIEGDAANKRDFKLPLYPNAQTTGAVETSTESSEKNAFMMLSSKDPVEKISDYYKTQLEQSGWKDLVANSMAKGLTNITARKDGYEASIMVSGGDSQPTSISLSVSKEIDGVPKQTSEVFKPDTLNPPTD